MLEEWSKPGVPVDRRIGGGKGFANVARLAGVDDGDRQMVDILTAVLIGRILKGEKPADRLSCRPSMSWSSIWRPPKHSA